MCTRSVLIIYYRCVKATGVIEKIWILLNSFETLGCSNTKCDLSLIMQAQKSALTVSQLIILMFYGHMFYKENKDVQIVRKLQLRLHLMYHHLGYANIAICADSVLINNCRCFKVTGVLEKIWILLSLENTGCSDT